MQDRVGRRGGARGGLLMGPPKKPVRRTNADGNLSLVQRLLLYDFLEERDGQLVLPLDFVDLLDLYSDTDELSDEDHKEK